MKYIKLFENFEDYDPYELMLVSPNDKTEMIFKEIEKKDKANLNLVSDLIALGANLDWQGDEGWTVIHECAYHNHPEILKMLIGAGADLNIQRDDGWTALLLSAYRNHSEIAKILIGAEADLNMQENNYGFTPLHVCANWNHPEILRMLIDAGADKTIQNNAGELPYELADTQELKKLLKP